MESSGKALRPIEEWNLQKKRTTPDSGKATSSLRFFPGIFGEAAGTIGNK